tara:strand:+ start:127 stop:387 length:261 start_codon:yes stop_codon:yes gene_type:complete
MVSKLILKHEQDLTNSKYLKCVAEGMKDWIEVKSLTGNQEIKKYRRDLINEIPNKPNKKVILKLLGKMRSLGLNKEIVSEFKGTFN